MKMDFLNLRLMLVYFLVLLVELFISGAYGAISQGNMRTIDGINKEGPYLGIIVPNAYEMNPLLQSPSFQTHQHFPYFDFAGRRFRIGGLGNEKVIIVMTGLSMLNAGIATQLLLSLFKVKGVLHYGIAGNANSQLQIGDVTIPRYWAHTGLWNWQRYGNGPDDELAFESDGDYTRSIGYLNLKKSSQFMELPEERQHLFWVPVDKHYFSVAKRLKSLKLGGCVNETCLPRTPMVVRVRRGISANVLLDNSAYRQFLNSKFNATPVDMETAAIALVCHQQNISFIAFRSLSDLAGGGSALSNEAAIFGSLAAQNAVDALLRFITLTVHVITHLIRL
ncbi:hypothetical protein Pint_13216 [Pistacia integerrima]|uniref:Uncharacterized protein n=1 Tax=Pistacia integerrima TaxID=434235 RepID=A0ACC0YAT1_9ROSI|nr:hypothetical protein Pint_13216 [Pistacia integerrima]